MMTMESPMDQRMPSPRHGLGRRVTAGVAAFVLSLATGVPLRSAENILPHPGEQATPYLGV